MKKYLLSLIAAMVTLTPLVCWALSCTFPTSTTFTPLHTYFMAATGCSDANAGTSAGSPWCNPDNNGHVSLVCGDVIIAAAGTYTGMAPTHSPATCPSTTAGIDGAGGVYFSIVLCGGSDLEACKINNTSNNGVELNVVNNWAFEGFKVSGASFRAFESKNCGTTGTASHHHAFINNVVTNSLQGFGMNDCGTAGAKSIDYWAAVGNIAQDANKDPFCVAAIDYVAPGNFDAVSGTHGFVHGNFMINGRSSCVSDGEGIMIDTLDYHSYTGQIIISNNMIWSSERFGIQIFYQANNVTTPTVKVHNNTLYGNNLGGGGTSTAGEINIQSTATTLPWLISVYNNIARTSLASGSGGSANYALLVATGGSGSNGNVVIGGSGIENVFDGLRSNCPSACDGGFNVVAFDGGSFGTNTYVDPAYTNVSDLITNRSGAVTCTGFTTTHACMGYNSATATLTTPSVISDLTPTAGGTSTKGFQKPVTTCASDAEYPVWLKGIVYLKWNGTIVQRISGLANLPCGM